ncbi:MAG TPA: segregation/condensation protein A [Spirochaetota bacterium]|nr:segregation/condensation protein A [Spirochaetota bacterium]HPI89675.1 segregation/condensation protein A [Spirochaetota bacterium]HPR49499.1 segregation/condensation protein A [Spirochaetota bacterium]
MQEDINTATTPESDDRYILHIDNFEGPLDLLWDLIKKAKIDITEVSLSQITEQYISYLKVMESINVKVATEFIWMASELLYYKSKALLPSGDMEDEYFVPPLPPELIAKLLEYKKFQKASVQLRELYETRADIYTRDNDVEELIGTDEYIEVSLFDLLKAFADVIESQSVIEQEEIIFDEILVSDRIEHITSLLKERDVVVFHEIFSLRPSRAEIVATFLAILEMTKTGIVKILQHRIFGDIRVLRNFILDEIKSEE